jgi:Coenzyme PQQ synthesis protein D (PqqD)
MVRVRIPDHVLHTQLDGSAVLLDLHSGEYFSLNEVGARLWAEIEAGESLDGALERLLEEFEVQRPVLERDVHALVDELLERGLLESLD